MFEVTDELRDQFWGRVGRDDGCWTWQGRSDKGGYGRLRVAGKERAAHRVAYFLATGDDPGPLCVLHECDNPPCVRPDHLFLGTNADNVRDRRTKGRTARKLDWDVVREMRRLYVEEGLKVREIDGRFGYTGCSAILRNRIWHDPDYVPPAGRKGGSRPALVEIGGESRTMKEWSEDPRCQVALDTIRQRHAAGVRGIGLILKETSRGRPRKSDAKDSLVRALDAEGLGLREINEALGDAGHGKVSQAYVDALTADYEVQDGLLDGVRLASEWAVRQKARELGLPVSVVRRVAMVHGCTR